MNPKTVAKWRRIDGVADAAIGPKRQHSTVLSNAEEALAIAFCQRKPAQAVARMLRKR